MPSSSRAPRTLVSAFAPADHRLQALVPGFLPGGISIQLGGGEEKAVQDTAEALKAGATRIYNAAFAYEGLLFAVDILDQKQGYWGAFHFRPSTRIKERYLVDIALFELALRHNGITVSEWHLLLLNTQYVRHGELDAGELFIAERVSRRLARVEAEVRPRLSMLKRMAERALKRGTRGGISDAPPSRFVLPTKEALAALPAPALAETVEILVEKEPLRSFLGSLRYPLYFMDFEAYQEALPQYDGHWPFRQLPFQFSVHLLEEPGADLKQEAFIAPGDAEPIAAFGEALLHATGTEGSVIVYNKDSEQLILNQLENDHPQWRAAIEGLRNRLVDLLAPFEKQYIRIPSIGNKLSLKYVLPALLPEMSYAALAIGTGDDANKAYNAIRSSTDPVFIRETCDALLEYCALDTFAMVRILERMRELAE